MKKYFFIAVAAVVALAACSKNDIDPTTQKDRAINFSAIAGKATKAPITSTYYGTNDPVFGMFCYVLGDNTNTPGTPLAWDSNHSNADVYMDNVQIKYNSSPDIWQPYSGSAFVTYYWPLSGGLTFIGYSPYMASGAAYDKETRTLTISNFTQEDDIDDQIDLMWATTQKDLQDNQHTYQSASNDTPSTQQGVNVIFHHALSQVKFFVKKAAGLEDYTLTVNSITFDAYSKGTFAIANDQLTTTTTGEGASAVTYNTNWTGQAKQNGFVFDTEGTNTEAPDNTDSFAAFGDANMTVPQQLATGVQTFTITYSLAKGNVALGSKTVPGIDLLGDAVKAWLPNTIYNYNIVIDLNKIYFNPTIVEWTSPEANQQIDVQ